ncbi:MAG: hypothetical protein Q7S73_03225 [bacterium]|nr:hypothetical protein [bacterium]
MKLFFINWARKDLGFTKVVKNLKKDGHEIVYWTSFLKEIDQKDFPETIFHEHLDALEGIPAPALLNEVFDPPGENLLHDMLEAESIVMTMMNKHFENKTVTERKYLYLNYIRYWNGVFKKYQPEAIIFPTIPHAVYDYLIYSLAKVHKIKTILMEPIWISDRVVIMNDFKNGSEAVSAELKRHLDRQILLGELSEDLQKEYKLQNSKEDATPIWHIYIKNKYSGYKFLKLKMQIVLKSIVNFTILRRLQSFLWKQFDSTIKKEYERVQQKPDFSKKFIYFPLHYQPERNSSPQGGVFVDQILMAETLSASLSDGRFLYIKEHPVQWLVRGLAYFSYRFRGYYEALAGLKNVKLVPIKTDTYELTNNSQAVATITGTAGWEALVRKKPVLAFGYPWYQHCPGLFRINGVDSCREALQKIAKGFSASTDDVLRYLYALDRASFHAYIDLDGKKVSQLNSEQNAINLTREISKILKA